MTDTEDHDTFPNEGSDPLRSEADDAPHAEDASPDEDGRERQWLHETEEEDEDEEALPSRKKKRKKVSCCICDSRIPIAQFFH